MDSMLVMMEILKTEMAAVVSASKNQTIIVEVDLWVSQTLVIIPLRR